MLLQATMAKNEPVMRVMRNIKKAVSDLKTASVGAIKEPTDSDIIKVIQKMVKELEKPIHEFEKAGRTELVSTYREEISILSSFLPPMLTEKETEEVVDKFIALAGATSIREMGKVMGLINKEYSGRVDGATVSRIVKSKLS